MVPTVLRFGPFELNLKAEFLKKDGSSVRLAPQPLKLLALLASRPEELVTREEIQKQLWAGETFVDFQQSVNQCIRQIRAALEDDAEAPQYIETVPRRGYRFIAKVNDSESDSKAASEAGSKVSTSPVRTSWLIRIDRRLALIGILAVLVVVTGLVTYRHHTHNHAFPLPVHAIAVLPLENLSGDPSEDYFAIGVTDALISNLAKSKALRVRPLSAITRFEHAQQSTEEIARELAVDALVKGSITRVNDKVRITTQLLEPGHSESLWVQSYDTNLPDLVVAESRLALLIGREINVNFDPAEERSHQPAPDAYLAYLHGHYLFNRQQRNKNDVRQSCEAFQVAIRIDAQFASPYAGMAECLQWLETRRYISYQESRAKSFAQKAVELDPDSARAHSILGAIHLYHDWDWPAARQELETALRLDPNDANAHFLYSEYLKILGKLPEALLEIRRAQELDPLEFHYLLSSAYFLLYMHQYQDAELEFRKVVAVAPENASALTGLIEAYEKQGLFRQAAEYWDKYESADDDKLSLPPFSELFKEHGFSAAQKEYWKEGIRHGEEQLRRGVQWEKFNLACLNAELKRKPQAIQFLRLAYADHMTPLINLKIDSRFDALRDDAAFQELLRSMKLDDAG